MAKTVTQAEIEKALNLAEKRGEDRQKYLGRVMLTGKKMDVKLWEKLSVPVQEFVNALIEADDENKEFPDFPDAKSGRSGDDRETSNSKEKDMAKNTKSGSGRGSRDEEERRPARGSKDTGKGGGRAGRSGKTAEKEKEAPARGKSATKASGGKPAGKSNRRKIKELVVKKPSVTVESLIGQFGGKDGMSDLSISSIRSDTLDTLRVADAAGCWKGPSLD